MTRQDTGRLGANLGNGLVFICRLIVFVIILHFAGKYWNAPPLEPALRDSLGLRGYIAPAPNLEDVPDLRIPDPEPRVSNELYMGKCRPARGFGDEVVVCW